MFTQLVCGTDIDTDTDADTEDEHGIAGLLGDILLKCVLGAGNEV